MKVVINIIYIIIYYISIYSQLSRKRTPSGIEKKCPLVELSAYENYSHKRTPEKNRVDGRLRES